MSRDKRGQPGTLPWEPAGNRRVVGSNSVPGVTFRQPLTPGLPQSRVDWGSGLV